MATIKWPRGKMTKPLTTQYEAGERVRLIADLEKHSEGPLPRVGDIGTIRRISISDPNDGDETVLVLDVKWTDYGRRMIVGEDEVTLATEADEWIRRQRDRLDVTKNSPQEGS